jgi:hypothetical protein
MKLSRWNYLYAQLLLMMAVMMAVSFIPEHLHEFFGDWKCNGAFWGYTTKNGWEMLNGDCYYYPCHENHGPKLHWGYRHWLMFGFGVAFTIINIVRIATQWEQRKEAAK